MRFWHRFFHLGQVVLGAGLFGGMIGQFLPPAYAPAVAAAFVATVLMVETW